MRIICLLIAFLIFQESAFAFQMGNVEIKLIGAISEMYDDNITYVKDNPKSDFSTTASAGLRAEYKGKLSSMTLSGNIKHQFFARNRDFDNISRNLSLNFSRELTKYDRFNLSNSFVHAEEPRSFEDQFGDTGRRYRYDRNKFSFGYNRDISKQISANLRYYNNTDKSSSSTASDSYMNRAEAGLDYALSSDLIFRGLYYFSKRKFESGPSASEHVFSGGFMRYFTNQLYLDVQLGTDIITSYDKTKFSKPVFTASLNDEIDENSYARISFSKKYEATSYSQNLFNSWRVSFDFLKQLFKRLALSLSAFYGQGEYTSINTKDNTAGGRAGLTYNLKDNIKVEIFYSAFKKTSNISANEYSRNTISVAVAVEF